MKCLCGTTMVFSKDTKETKNFTFTFDCYKCLNCGHIDLTGDQRVDAAAAHDSAKRLYDFSEEYRINNVLVEVHDLLQDGFIPHEEITRDNALTEGIRIVDWDLPRLFINGDELITCCAVNEVTMSLTDYQREVLIERLKL